MPLFFDLFLTLWNFTYILQTENQEMSINELQQQTPTDGKLVWQDEERRLYFEGNEPVMVYKGERYTFGCQPYEPMAIIQKDGKAVAFIHNAFDPDEMYGK